VLVNAERGGDATTAADVRLALDELLSDRDTLTRRLLGAGGDDEPPPPPMAYGGGYAGPVPGLAPRD
jgi:hypothetical protein